MKNHTKVNLLDEIDGNFIIAKRIMGSRSIELHVKLQGYFLPEVMDEQVESIEGGLKANCSWDG